MASVPEKLLAPAIVKSAVNVTADLPVCCTLPVQWPAKSYGVPASAPLASVVSANAAPSSVTFTLSLPSPPRRTLQRWTR